MIDYDSITKPIAVVTAVMGAVGGGYALVDKTGLMKKDILKWDAEHFEISNGPVLLMISLWKSEMLTTSFTRLTPLLRVFPALPAPTLIKWVLR